MNKFIIALLVLFTLSTCTQQNQNLNEERDEEPDLNKLVSEVHPAGENDISGSVTFVREGNEVFVDATIRGLEPDTRHGFHIHRFGDCTAEDATSAGGHLSPDDMPHGAPNEAGRHMGDMGNLVAGENGIAELSYTDNVIDLSTIRGRAVIIHKGSDDFESQPSGDAGPRIGCGVIGIAQS